MKHPGFFQLAPAFVLAFWFAVTASGQTNLPRWNVLDEGAIGDGATDCTTAFQRVLDRAGKAGGAVVEVPAGQYRIAGHLAIPANTTLQGIYRVPPTCGPMAIGKLTGSVLFAYEGRGTQDGPPFIQLAGNNAAIAGLIIAYPDWKQTDVPPIPYPPCVASTDTENVGVRDCCLLNPYEGIKLVRAHRHMVRNVTGYPIWRGLYVDECYDIGHIENVHYWPFGVNYKPEDPFCQWVNTQGVAFEWARTDWHYVHNTFCFGYGVGYKFSQSKQGSANGNFLGIGADSCQRAVVVEQAQPPGLLISNGEFVGRWSSTDAVCMVIAPGVEGKVSLVNCSFWGPIDRCVWMRAPAGQLTASACNFVQWDQGGVGSPALQIDAGRAIVQGCTFGQEGLAASIGPKAISAILTANQAAGGFRVDNQAGKKAQIALNEGDNIEWGETARRHYALEIGAPGDGRYLRNWNGQERVNRPVRWSGPVSQLSLPVNPGEAYTLSMELSVPPAALSPEAGLYLDGQRLCPLTATNRLTTALPPSKETRQVLELRCKSWVPRETNPGSQDGRTLGVQVFSVTMQSATAGARKFSANTGEWLEEAK
jgi:hypothetical protein